ncbi:MAG TPA: hypothetical protein VNO70_23025 [Blastocatellia bacterium]|nr:hypothetical protein [Blastocatellia bacterium]
MSLKLGAICAASAVLPIIASLVIAHFLISSEAEARAAEQLNSQTRAAASIYEKRLAEMRLAAQKLAIAIANRALVTGDRDGRESGIALAPLQDLLPPAQNEHNLDFVTVANSAGQVITRHNGLPAAGETVLPADGYNPELARVFSEGRSLRAATAAYSVIESADFLRRVGLEQSALVPASDPVVKDGLMMEAAAPIFLAGRFLGVVLIGQMLNNTKQPRNPAIPLQTPLVTEIRQAIYGDANKNSGAVIALGDVIIASSFAGGAVGGETPDAAINGLNYRAAMQGNLLRSSGRQYAAAWHPIKAPDNTQVGALGVIAPADELAGPYTQIRTMLILLGLIALLLAGAGGYLFGRTLAARLNAISDAAGRMSVGELSTTVRDPDGAESGRIMSVLSRDEISNLAEQLDQTRESFKQAIERLRKR